MRVFISHSSENAELAKELCGKLEVLALALPLVSRLLSDLRELLP